MRYRCILVLAAAFTTAACGGFRVAGDELPAKDHPSPEPFEDVKPFDLSNRIPADGRDAKEPSDAIEKTRATTEPSTELNRKVTEEIGRVNDLGDPERIVFEGVSLFPESGLRLALGCDLKYQASARPSNETVDLLEMLEKRLTDGYLLAGCPDAKVRASRDGKRKAIVVHVDEGSRYRKGEIRVTGSKNIDDQSVREFLTRPQPSRPWVFLVGEKPLEEIGDVQRDYRARADVKTEIVKNDDATAAVWKLGDPFDFRDPKNSPLETAVRCALAELGWADSQFQMQLLRENKRGTVDLEISIVGERPRVVLGDIEVTGLKRDSRKAFLDFLEIAPGDPIDGPALRRMKDRLTDSCRYWTHGITVALPAGNSAISSAPAKATLRFALEEYTDAPPLGQPLSPTDEVMRKCGSWINSLARGFGGRDLVCTTAAVDLGGLAQHAQIALSADGMLVVDAQVKSKGTLRFDHSIILGGQNAEIYDWQFGDKCCGSPLIQPTFEIRIATTHDNNGKQQGSMRFGYSAKGGDDVQASAKMLCDIRVEPVALVRFAHLPSTKVSIRDGVLTFSGEPFEIQIDETTGAVRNFKSASFLSAGISAVDIKAEKGAVARMVNEVRKRGSEFHNGYDGANPLGSILIFTLKQIERQPGTQQSPTLVRVLKRAATAIDCDGCRQLFAKWSADARREKSADRFWIPASDKTSISDSTTFVKFYIPFLADRAFPRGSWPWTFCREYSFLAFANNVADETPEQFQQKCAVELNRMFGRKDFGPLGGLVMTKLLQAYLGNDNKSVAATAALSLEDPTDEAFLKDIHLLTNGDEGLAVACRAIAEKCGDLSREDQEVIGQFLPQIPRDAFAKLIARRDEKPDELPTDAIRAVMLEGWHCGWKDAVEAELRSMPTEASSAAKISGAEK
jgi:hypothetical protein